MVLFKYPHALNNPNKYTDPSGECPNRGERGTLPLSDGDTKPSASGPDRACPSSHVPPRDPDAWLRPGALFCHRLG